jgi:transposase-like protein
VQVNIKHLVDDVQCYQTVRELRWPDGVACPSCQSKQVIKRGFDDTEPARQRYELSLSRLNHWLPRIQAHPEVVQGTTEFHHQIADALLPQTDPVFHNAAALSDVPPACG